MSFDAWNTYEKIKKQYIDFLLDNSMGAFPEAGSEESWHKQKKQLKNLWEKGNDDGSLDSLFAEPLVDFSFPYMDDENGTLTKLCTEHKATSNRPLHPKLVELLQKTNMKNWVFKNHQVESFVKSIDHEDQNGSLCEGKSIIVSSGTGSGKTESFLIPMLNKMFWEENEESLAEPGVRVLIIYPMNALVNNQLQRLQDLLGEAVQCDIKFGFYTSRLKEQLTNSQMNAMKPSTKELYQDTNFVRDRKTLRQKPPHILVTNYSMLELMLIRPKDHSIFSNKLQTIVLDEAHVYSGALGTDVSLLLRRTADRFGTDMKNLTGIATSATLDNTKDSLLNLQKFGAQLFSKKIEDIHCITGKRKQLNELSACFRGNLPFKNLDENDSLWLLEFDAEHEPSAEVNERLLELLEKAGVVPSGFTYEIDTYKDFLYEVFSKNESLKRLRREFYKDGHPSPISFSEIKNLLVGEDGQDLLCIAFLSLFSKASLVKADDVDFFLPGKVHTFIRAPYRLWTDLKLSADQPLGTLHDNQKADSLLFPVYVSGNIRRDFYFKVKFGRITDEATLDTILVFVNPGTRKASFKEAYIRLFNASIDGKDTIRFKLRHSEAYVEIHEDQQGCFVFARDENSKPLDDIYHDDVDFKTIDGKKITGQYSSIEGDDPDEIPEIKLSQLGGINKDIIDSILAESLIQHLPVKDPEKTADGRGTLVFADNRQGAAWRATYIQDGYNKNVARNFIYNISLRDRSTSGGSGASSYSIEQIEELKNLGVWDSIASKQSSGNQVETISLLKIQNALYRSNKFRKEMPLVPQLEEHLKEDLSGEFWRQCVEAYVHRELLVPMMQTRNLESMGFLRSYYRNDFIPKLEEKDWGMHSILVDLYKHDDWQLLWPSLIAQIYDFMRMAGAISYEDPSGKPKNYQMPYQEIHASARHIFNKYYFTQLEKKQSRAEMGFISAINIRKYCERLIQSCGVKIDSKLLDIVLENIFDILVKSKPAILKVLSVDDKPTISIDPEKLEFEVLDKDGRLEFHSNAYRMRLQREDTAKISIRASANGQYEELNKEQEESLKGSRDYNLYTEKNISGIRASEHTAQLSADQLKEIENKFNSGDVNLLCCSTTMELGIDLDGLVSVVLGNLPPEPSNYIQRAGRAGRRNDPSSIVITVLRQNPYDLSVFDNSKLLYDRVMKLGHIRFDDRRIIERHVFAYILTDFFRECCDATKNRFRSPMGSWSDLQSFFGNFEDNKSLKSKAADYEEIIKIVKSLPFYNKSCESIYHLFINYLYDLDGRLDVNISRIIEHTEYDSEPIDSLIEILRGRIESEYDKYQQNLDTFAQQEKYCREEGNDKGLGSLKYQKTQYLNQPLVSYLAKELVIPRYGFPVDVVELITKNKTTNPYDKDKKDFDGAELSRGLEMAISQYSPGSEVVVNHQIFKSEGIAIDKYEPEASAIQKKHFIICKSCGSFKHGDTFLERCSSCGHPTDKGLVQNGDDDSLDCPPSIVKDFLLPRAFSISYDKGPIPANERLHYDNSQGYSCVSVNTDENKLTTIGQFEKTSLKYAYLPDHDLFFFNGGLGAKIVDRDVRGRGFCICMTCGFSLPESYESDLPSGFESHKVLYSTERCKQHNVARNVILGGTSKADVMVFRIPHSVLSSDVTERNKVCETFKHALVLAGADMLEADARIIASQLYHFPDSSDIILYDTSGSATGYLLELDKRRGELLEKASEILICRKAEEDGNGRCETGCFNCLLNYTSAQDYEKGRLDRTLTRTWWSSTRKSLIGEGRKFHDCKVLQNSLCSQLFRYDSKAVMLVLKELDLDNLHDDFSLLYRLYKKAVKDGGFSLKILLKKSCLEGLSKMKSYELVNTLNVWSSSNGVEVRETEEEFKDDVFGKVNNVPFFSCDITADDFTQQNIFENADWYFACQSEESSNIAKQLDDIWDKSSELELADISEDSSILRINIPGRIEASVDFLSDLILDNSKLKLREKVAGKKVKRILYQDRFLIKAESIRNLYHLLKCFNINNETELRLITNPDERYSSVYIHNISDLLRKKTYHTLGHDSASNSEFQTVANYFYRDLGCKVEMVLLNREAKSTFRNEGWEGEQHARQLLVEFEDDTAIVMLFDLGMSWASPENSISHHNDPGLPVLDIRRKFLTAKTYVLVTTELNEFDRELWTLTSNVPSEFGCTIVGVSEQTAFRI